MKIIKIPCPNCGGTLSLESDKAKCSYCGAEFPIKNEDINVNINKRDEARIKEAESAEKIKIKQLENIEKQQNREHAELKWFAIIFILFFIFFIAMNVLYNHNVISMPMSSSMYEGENYEQVIKDLKNTGFVNITTAENQDLITGWITKDGSVENISINGNHNFKKGDSFPKNATIVITYHTFKK